ncbi:hypothetical protein NE237_025322 [Protea cynaroides]|uniref:Uncharacterized protein n=1 Tax=Protea cynaroides TaxID=273540 RepID=A0A9Q0H403_9MAGN|nr:hypothetical protein NE237_025322 [Protea cynaroides]
MKCIVTNLTFGADPLESGISFVALEEALEISSSKFMSSMAWIWRFMSSTAWIWKLKRFLNIGSEKRLREAIKAVSPSFVVSGFLCLPLRVSVRKRMEFPHHHHHERGEEEEQYPPPGYHHSPPSQSEFPDYPSVHHVSHHQYEPEYQPQPGYHHGGSGSEPLNKPTSRVYCKAETDYSLTIRDGHVILALSDVNDPFQHWIKDETHSTRVKDAEGFPSFSLVNKATGQALKHSIGATQPVQLIPYDPDVLDLTILWSESRDFGDNFRTIRMVLISYGRFLPTDLCMVNSPVFGSFNYKRW